MSKTTFKKFLNENKGCIIHAILMETSSSYQVDYERELLGEPIFDEGMVDYDSYFDMPCNSFSDLIKIAQACHPGSYWDGRPATLSDHKNFAQKHLKEFLFYKAKSYRHQETKYDAELKSYWWSVEFCPYKTSDHRQVLHIKYAEQFCEEYKIPKIMTKTVVDYFNKR